MENAMNQRIFCLTVLALVIPGGISAQSIHPFFEDDDVVFRPELLGKWNLEGEVALEFRDLGQKTYGITLHMDKDSAIYFRAHLFCVSEKCFLDGQVAGLKLPNAPGEDSPASDATRLTEAGAKEFQLDKSDFLLNRAHGLILLTFSSDPNEFFAAPWEESWLPRMDANGTLSMSHTKDDLGRVLLTAETEALREWVKDLPKEAFDNTSHLTREKDEDQSKPSAERRSKDAVKEEGLLAGGEAAELAARGDIREIVLLAQAPVDVAGNPGGKRALDA
jgi:hypothetical protein